SRVRVVTIPYASAPDVARSADDAVRAIGGAGFDALVARAQRIWQIATAVESGNDRAPLAVAAILASVMLAPIVPPSGGPVVVVPAEPVAKANHALALDAAWREDVQVQVCVGALQHAMLVPLGLADPQHVTLRHERRHVRGLVRRVRDNQQHVDARLGCEP